MRVSFDVDDTLICRDPGTPAEVVFAPALLHRWFGEPLRRGAVFLMSELRRQGCSIWVYTTSGRTPLHIRRWLFLHGVRIDGVVNDERHRAAIRRAVDAKSVGGGSAEKMSNAG